jgi:transcription elongation GreA/GreB family factor
MNKALLLKQIIKTLENVHQVALNAANQAHETATNKESIAENKYDTFGLEASYLAHGMAQRVSDCDADLATFKTLENLTFTLESPIKLGALIELVDEKDIKQFLFLGPAAGGLKIIFCEQEITVITLTSPIGKALLGNFVDDEIEIVVGNQKKYYEIVRIY